MRTKSQITLFVSALLAIIIVMSAFTFKRKPAPVPASKGCVFRTLFGEDSSDSNFIYKTPEKAIAAIDRALDWIITGQHSDGGWGAGSHYNQNVMDPMPVHTDPATTSFVAMALLRTGSTPTSGKYSHQLNDALNYLLAAVENAPQENLNITNEKNTQIQIKLGENIDVVLTAQFLTNVLDYLNDPKVKSRTMLCLNNCINRIQRAQTKNGSMNSPGWAGVLQSAFATNVLETASLKGAKVDSVLLEKSRDYHKRNYDVKSRKVATDQAAGIMLYSLAGTIRASAVEAKQAKEIVQEAKQDGRLEIWEDVTVGSLMKAGLSESDALMYSTAYQINNSARDHSFDENVLEGFGNKGGEEFISYLQTGEALIISRDNSWKKWYDNTSGSLLKIQNTNGSWNGHHCITSPVFCTATCILILSVNNDVEELVSLGNQL